MSEDPTHTMMGFVWLLAFGVCLFLLSRYLDQKREREREAERLRRARGRARRL